MRQIVILRLLCVLYEQVTMGYFFKHVAKKKKFLY